LSQQALASGVWRSAGGTIMREAATPLGNFGHVAIASTGVAPVFVEIHLNGSSDPR
jgi:hypothetical protein